MRQVYLKGAQRSCADGKGKFSFLPLIHTRAQDLYLRDIPVQVAESTHFFSAWHNEEALELHDSACVCSKLTCKLHEFCVSLQSGECSFYVPSTDMIQKHRARGSLRLQSEAQCLVFEEVVPALRV